MLVQSENPVVFRTSRVAWQRLLTELVHDPSARFAFGETAGLASVQSTLLCARRLKTSHHAPNGNDQSELAAWCVIVFMDRFSHSATPGLYRRLFQPRHAQQLTVLAVDSRSQSSSWAGWIFERGEIRALDGLQIVGASPLESYRDAPAVRPDETLSDSQRYSRLQPVLGEAYSKVRNSTVLVVGSSRSGTLACMELAALGINRLINVEPDLVEMHNLDGMFWAQPEDVGRPKVLVNAQRLSEFRPDMTIYPMPHSIRDPYISMPTALCDLIVTCVDDEVARNQAARLASSWLIPHLDIATQVVDSSAAGKVKRELRADVRLVLPGEGCLACVGGQLSQELADFMNLAPLTSLTPSQITPWPDQRLGSLITINAIAVSIGIQTWLQYLTKELTGSIWHRINWRTPAEWGISAGYVRGRSGAQCCGL